MILTGELAPGDRLPPEGNLAAALGLSRTSLREAVRALTVLGVIDTRQGDASYITNLGPELLLGALGLAVDLQREEAMPDLIAVRRILEPAATALAASRITVEEIHELRTLIPSGFGDERASEFVELDREFHHTIARAGGNVLLLALLDGLTQPTMRMRASGEDYPFRESWPGPWMSTRRSSTRSNRTMPTWPMPPPPSTSPASRPGSDPKNRAGAPWPHAQSTGRRRGARTL